MTSKLLTDILERAEAWPPHVQAELAAFARELDDGVAGRDYHPTPNELIGIDRGLEAAEAGRFASTDQVNAVFAKFRSR